MMRRIGKYLAIRHLIQMKGQHTNATVPQCPFCAEDIQVAAVVCKHCGRDVSGPSGGSSDAGRRRSALIGAFAVVGVLTTVGFAASVWTGADGDSIAGNLLPAREFTLGQQALEIGPGSWESWSWDIDPRRPSCRVTVTVRGISGGNRDFEAFLMDENGYRNWVNRTNPSAFYQSGRVSSATVEGIIHGAGPKYYLVVSNRFSTFTGKTVEALGGRVVCTGA
jgi:hypothetical protein